MKYGTTGKQGSQRKIKTPIHVTTVVADEIKVSPAEVAALGLRHLLSGVPGSGPLDLTSLNEWSIRVRVFGSQGIAGRSCNPRLELLYERSIRIRVFGVCGIAERSNSPEIALFDKWSNNEQQ
jgi:hypothetical protein